MQGFSLQEMQLQMPTFLVSQNVASWLPDCGQNHGQMFDASVPYIPIRDISSAVYNPILQGSSSNIDQRVMGECHIDCPDNENLPAWHHTYASTDPSPFHIPPSHLFISIQQGREEPGMAGATPHDQAKVTSKSSVEQPDTEAANYEGEPVTKPISLTGISDRG
ncbi:agamous-like MADS-box protein AGL104 [Actinidia eriantha]|uniref:agamous-like MADS-box protein AGL104 n=1 Tax=Actinidia eriantha TaxID=165200 RepID=UPI0025829AC8|nr:agamous-like MADS-box protein AGL104 [Actinidia eriantha]